MISLGCPRGGLVEAPVAVRFRARLLGLSGIDPRAGRGLVIPRCASVHTLGMRRPIDVAFATWVANGNALRLLAVHAGVLPGRVLRWRRRPMLRRRHVVALELAAGEAARLGLRPGVMLPMLGWREPRQRRGG